MASTAFVANVNRDHFWTLVIKLKKN